MIERERNVIKDALIALHNLKGNLGFPNIGDHVKVVEKISMILDELIHPTLRTYLRNRNRAAAAIAWLQEYAGVDYPRATKIIQAIFEELDS